MPGGPWNSSFGGYYNPQINVLPITGPTAGGQSFYTGAGGFYNGANSVAVPQTCTAMTGDRVTVQPLAGPQPGGMY